MLPIENSLAGLVAETCDLLADGDLPIGSTPAAARPSRTCAATSSNVPAL